MKEIMSAFLSVFLAFFTPACSIAGTITHSDSVNSISADTQPTVISAPATEQNPEKVANESRLYSKSMVSSPAPSLTTPWLPAGI